jgi:PH (Pleckstrin Homology) domain-containing protein/putative oligomerization/nucleic acid binding protein
MSYVQRMLGEHERLVFTTHQHWMVLASSVMVNLALALLIIIVAGIVWIPLMFPLGWAAALLLVVPVARFIYHFLVWENREFIITNRRVIQISGVLNKNVFDSSLEKVNDVKMSQSLFGRIFDYGDVEIMTAAEEGENLFRRILGPLKFKTAMLNQKEAMGVSEVPAGAAPPTVDVPTLIENLAQLRKQGLITEDEYQRKKQDLLARL